MLGKLIHAGIEDMELIRRPEASQAHLTFLLIVIPLFHQCYTPCPRPPEWKRMERADPAECFYLTN